jgi:hypothetical protein
VPRRSAALVPPTALAARYTTLLAREKTPQALAKLYLLVDQEDPENQLPEIQALKTLMQDQDGKVAVAAAKTLANARWKAAEILLQVAKLTDARLEDIDPTTGQRVRAPQAHVTVVIARQGREIHITEEGSQQRLTVSEDETAEGELISERMSIGVVEAAPT